MADRIKGITVEIGGDTTDLSKALKETNDESRKIGKELSDVNRLLKFDPSNTELLAQRQELLGRQINNTSERLQHLRSVEEQVQRQFERGDIGADQFRAFRREIITTEGRLQHFQTEAETTSRNVRGAFSQLGEGLKGAIGAAVAGEGIKEVITQSLESAHLDTKIKIGFDVPEEARGAVKGLITSIKAYGIEGEAAIEGVRRQFALNADKTTEENTKLVKYAGVIASAYSGIDFTELIQETNEMAGSMEITQEQALGMTNQLLKMGFPPDQLDIITEYGAQLHRAGYDISEIQGIFAAGINTKSWNIDKLLDGVKEGRIRLAEFAVGVDKTTLGLIKGTDISAEQLKKWGEAVAAGGEEGKIAFGEVATKLANIKDEGLRNAIGVQFFGTMWEDTGKKITETLLNAKDKAGETAVNMKNLNDTVKQTDADPQVKLNQALGDMQTKLTPLFTMVAEYVTKIADWVQKNPELAAGIAAVAVGLGILIGLVTTFALVLNVLTGAAVALDIGLLPLIGIILLVVAAIGIIIAVGVLLYKNWDIIMQWAQKLAASIVKSFNDWKEGVKQRMTESWNQIKSIWTTVMNFFGSIDLAKTGRDIMNGLLNGITGMASKIWEKAKEIAKGIGDKIKSALGISSPSKLTMQLGLQTGQGLVEGLQNSFGSIQKASARMAAAAVPEVPTNNIQNQTIGSKALTVNITSPKALDVREANREFNRTLNKMALMW